MAYMRTKSNALNTIKTNTHISIYYISQKFVPPTRAAPDTQSKDQSVRS